ncbi:MAG: hypothetical protein M1836_003806 [Candelina mexicana]|nr:MAG: hypothetical protein M1836_003806 [Candelina mexicana]
MDRPRSVLIFFVLLFIFLSPAGQPPTVSQRQDLDDLITRERHALSVLSSSSYGDLDPAKGKRLNITGLREEDRYAWELLPRVKDRVREQLGVLAGHQGVDQRSDNGANESVATQDGNKEVIGRDDFRYTDKDVMRPEKGSIPVYQNVTGILRGEWVRSKVAEGLQAPHINVTSFGPNGAFNAHEYDRNVTGSGGKVHLRLKGKNWNGSSTADGMVREIKAQMTIKDDTSSGDGWEMTLHGVHYPEMGEVLLTTTSEKCVFMTEAQSRGFAGLFALPHFAVSQRTYALAQRLLNSTLSQAIDEQQRVPYTTASNPWSSSPNNPSDTLFPLPHCEYIIYLQQHPIGLMSKTVGKPSDIQKLLAEVENELRFPNGAPVPKAPDIRMSLLIFSPDCGFVLESKGPPEYALQHGNHLHGPKLESYLASAQRYILLFAVLIAGQVILLMRQMKVASTPPTRSRISFYTIAMMSMGDGFVFIGFLMAAIFVDAAFLTLITTAFLAFFAVCFFGMKFLLDIWLVQAPERRERERQLAAASPPPPPPPAAPNLTTPLPGIVITPASANTLPLPATARRTTDSGATPVILPPDQDLDGPANDTPTSPTNTPTQANTTRRELSSLYTRFYFLLLTTLLLSFHATTWPTTARTIYTNTLLFTYFSLWTPQIYRNIMRNCRKALSHEFILGQSTLRLAPVLYIYTIPHNILFIDPDRTAALILTAWVWLQILILTSQEILGPRFAIPDTWTPPAYDYHPVLREDDVEAGIVSLPIGFSRTTDSGPTSPTTSAPPTNSSKARPRYSVDCAICMQTLEVPVEPRGGAETSSASGGVGIVGNGLGSGILGRRSYMVTPCRHVFHTVCLEGWMRFRLVCPVCREDLPAL